MDLSQQDFEIAVANAYDKLNVAQKEMGKFIFGQGPIIEAALMALLAGGHMLLIGVPGLAKTKLVSLLSKVIGMDHKRIQCTPDLMPADIIGTEVLEEVDYGRRNFRFIPGPVFCQFLMVDEINRASPRTQSALIQAMEEQMVSLNGRERALPSPFHVLATQNPLEQEGTFPLPEAELDRFLIQITIDYPDLAAERAIVQASMQTSPLMPKAAFFADDLKEMQTLTRQISIEPQLLNLIIDFIRAGRPTAQAPSLVQNYVAWGPGPRATQALSLAMCARALLKGRTQATIEDLFALKDMVLKHRMALNYRARADGITLDHVIEAMQKAALPAS
ncbi:MAG: MoxR family ATPase [Alphaproteobacteria bacterium]|nr:MoxR family ATPase [Alphaproteobacteria bacterium]